MTNEHKEKIRQAMKAKYAKRKPINPAARVVFHNWVSLNGSKEYGVKQ